MDVDFHSVLPVTCQWFPLRNDSDGLAWRAGSRGAHGAGRGPVVTTWGPVVTERSPVVMARGGVPTARSLGPAPTQRGPQGPVSSPAAVSPPPGSAPYGSPLSPGHRPSPSDPCHSPRDALVPLSPPGTGQGSPAPTGCARGRRLAPWRPGIRHLQPGGREGPRGTSRRSQAWRPQRRVNLSEAGARPRPRPTGGRKRKGPKSSFLCSSVLFRPWMEATMSAHAGAGGLPFGVTDSNADLLQKHP